VVTVRDPDYYSTAEAAAKLRISVGGVVKRIERGKLRAVRFGGGRWKIPRDVVDAMLQSAQAPQEQ
jgi:excisionase family DNA binding protein